MEWGGWVQSKLLQDRCGPQKSYEQPELATMQWIFPSRLILAVTHAASFTQAEQQRVRTQWPLDPSPWSPDISTEINSNLNPRLRLKHNVKP